MTKLPYSGAEISKPPSAANPCGGANLRRYTMGGRGSSSGRRSAKERRNRVDVQAGQLVQGGETNTTRTATPVASAATARPARTTSAASRARLATASAATPARTTPVATPQQRTATQRKPRLTQARAQSAADASFSRSSWDVMNVRKSNGTWTVYVSKKAYGDGYEARGEVRNGRILNDEMGMGEKALDFARRTGAKKVVVIGYAD